MLRQQPKTLESRRTSTGVALLSFFISVLIIVYLSKGGSMIYHVTQTFTTYEYYRVEANSEEEAKEKVHEGTEEQYDWDQTYESTEVQKVT